ncbi:MAG: hypothetical protein ABEK16_04980 [Candidatus Nanohalobium sp.]
MAEDQSGISFTMMLTGLAVAALPQVLQKTGFSYTFLSQVFLGIYGLTVLIGGAYRGSGQMNYFVDMAGATGLILVLIGSPLSYPLGVNAWHWLTIGLTFLLAVPATALVILTRNS